MLSGSCKEVVQQIRNRWCCWLGEYEIWFCVMEDSWCSWLGENENWFCVMTHRWRSWLREYENWFCVMTHLMQLVGRIWKLVLCHDTVDAAGWEKMKIGFVSQHTDDAAGWENMKIGFVSWHTVDAAGWENMKNGFIMAHSWYSWLGEYENWFCVTTHRWCSWLGEYGKWFYHGTQLMQLVGRIWKLVLCHSTFQNPLYSFHASAWLQYLSHDHRAPSAPAVLKTNLTDFIPLQWQFIVKTWKTWGNP